MWLFLLVPFVLPLHEHIIFGQYINYEDFPILITQIGWPKKKKKKKEPSTTDISPRVRMVLFLCAVVVPLFGRWWPFPILILVCFNDYIGRVTQTNLFYLPSIYRFLFANGFTMSPPSAIKCYIVIGCGVKGVPFSDDVSFRLILMMRWHKKEISVENIKC